VGDVSVYPVLIPNSVEAPSITWYGLRTWTISQQTYVTRFGFEMELDEPVEYSK